MTAGQPHIDGLVQQAERLPGHDGRTCAGPASGSFTHPAFEHAQVEVPPVTNVCKANIGLLRKTFVPLQYRSQFIDRGGVDIVDVHYAMRIADRYNAGFDICLADGKRVAICALPGDERDLVGLEFGRSHADSNQPIVIDARMDHTRRAQQRKCLWMAAQVGKNAGDAAHTVAALFDFGAVVVEDTVACRERRILRRSYPHQLVKTRPGCLISDLAKLLRRRWRRRFVALVDDENPVTCAVHFCVSNVHQIICVPRFLVGWTFVFGVCSLHKPENRRTITNLITLPLESVMRHIMVMNAKGGCGKSTLATNIASYFASEGATVALADYDHQRSSLDWLERRPADRPQIAAVAGFEDGLRHAPRNADILVIDAPARSHGKELTNLVAHAETIVVPVLPSTIDMQATTTFLGELRGVGKIERKQAKFGLVANRVRDNTLIFDDLDEYLTKAKAPYIAALREAQNYVRAYTRGLGIFELPEYLAWPDWDEWEPLTAWLRSRRSQP